MAERAYLDHAATAPLSDAARTAMVAALARAANASSVHAEGRAARGLIERAREAVAALAGRPAGEVTFTSGGTEANALALTPDLGAVTCDRLVMPATEHVSVLQGHRFAAGAVRIVPVDSAGLVDLAALDDALAGAARPLVSVMAVNNETGVMQDLAAVAGIVRARRGVLHVDAVQAAGKLALASIAALADLVTLTAHKFGGPQGAGALIARAEAEPMALIRGGGQERRRRAGTENVAAIAGFGATAEAALAGSAGIADEIRATRDGFELELRAIAPDVVIFGMDAPRSPAVSCFAVPGLAAETALIALDLAGVAVSSGSACSSGKVARSHVLAAMGVSDSLARAALRVSLGPTSTARDTARCLEALAAHLRGLRRTAKTPAAYDIRSVAVTA